MEQINIAIDGYSACGKSSTAKIIAKQLNFIYVDTGAMYRAVTFYFINNKIDLKDEQAVKNALSNINIEFKREQEQLFIYLNGVDVSQAIRQMEINQLVSEVSAISAVRRKMVQEQKSMARRKGVVMDGRDIASVVMPDAELKFFMIADIDIRTKRRMKELNLEDKPEIFEKTKANLLHRDHIDSTRTDSPLVQVEDAIVIDTSHITMEEQINQILSIVDKLNNTK
ncbi:MAG: (d)CMP kinase [Chitinophagales bacterium]